MGHNTNTGVSDRMALVAELLIKDGAATIKAPTHYGSPKLDDIVAAYCALRPQTPIPQTLAEKRKLISDYLAEVAARPSMRGHPFKEYKPSKAMEAAAARCREPIQLQEHYDEQAETKEGKAAFNENPG